MTAARGRACLWVLLFGTEEQGLVGGCAFSDVGAGATQAHPLWNVGVGCPHVMQRLHPEGSNGTVCTRQSGRRPTSCLGERRMAERRPSQAGHPLPTLPAWPCPNSGLSGRKGCGWPPTIRGVRLLGSRHRTSLRAVITNPRTTALQPSGWSGGWSRGSGWA